MDHERIRENDRRLESTDKLHATNRYTADDAMSERETPMQANMTTQYDTNLTGHNAMEGKCADINITCMHTSLGRWLMARTWTWSQHSCFDIL